VFSAPIDLNFYRNTEKILYNVRTQMFLKDILGNFFFVLTLYLTPKPGTTHININGLLTTNVGFLVFSGFPVLFLFAISDRLF